MTKSALARSTVSKLVVAAALAAAAPALAATAPKHAKTAPAGHCVDANGKAIAGAAVSACTAPNQWVALKTKKHTASAKKAKQSHIASAATKNKKNHH